MTMQERLDLIEANAKHGAKVVEALTDMHLGQEARAQKAIEQDISSIQDTLTCLKGMCSLQWKPAK